METILQKITDWLKGILTDGIMENLSGVFDAVNTQVGDVADQVGTSPQNFAPQVFSMIQSISQQVILPIAGIILTFVACYELLQMIMEHNNLANFETWFILKWVFKTCIAVTLISHTTDIVLAVFDVAQYVVSSSSGIISGSTAVSAAGIAQLQASLKQMDLGPLLTLYLQSFIIQITMWVLSIVIFVIVYGRMIEIYMMVSLAPIPMATLGSREQGRIGQNYLRSLLALGFQGVLIMICVAIYAVLIQYVSISDDAISSIWGIVGYTVLLCFTLFKTSSISRSVFDAH